MLHHWRSVRSLGYRSRAMVFMAKRDTFTTAQAEAHFLVPLFSSVFFGVPRDAWNNTLCLRESWRADRWPLPLLHRLAVSLKRPYFLGFSCCRSLRRF